jgi:5-methyltetrahydrofolate--homocysteine methyltransferase
LSSFLGPAGLIKAMKRRPGVVDACRAIILEKLLLVYDDLQGIIEREAGPGCNSWLNVWCPQRWYPIQCDFSAMLSPAWFQRFVLPDIQAQAEHMDHALYHLDGPNQLPYVEDLLALDALDGIQWVPGSGQPDPAAPAWRPLCHKIAAAGKKVVIHAAPEDIPGLYADLPTKSLFVSTVFISPLVADFYLPEWLGGRNGIDEDDDED